MLCVCRTLSESATCSQPGLGGEHQSVVECDTEHTSAVPALMKMEGHVDCDEAGSVDDVGTSSSGVALSDVVVDKTGTIGCALLCVIKRVSERLITS